MVTMGGGGGVQMADTCPEYTLVSDRVVYVIVGKSSGQLIPLADVVDFRIVHADLAVRLDDSRHESKFSIKEMLLRSEWDLLQKHMTEELSGSSHAPDDVALRNRD